MECRVNSDSLSALLDDELAGEQRQAVQQHLRECAACRDELESLRFSFQLTDRLASIEAPPDLWSRVETRITPPPSARPTAAAAATQGLRRFLWPAVAAVAAALALAVGLSSLSAPAYPTQIESYLQERELRYQQNIRNFLASEFDFDGGTANPFRPVAHEGANPFR